MNNFVYMANTYGVFVFTLLGSIVLWRAKDKKGAYLVFVAAVVAGIVSIALKELFGVPRPLTSSPSAGLAMLGSFPSSHAAFAFASATVVAYHKRTAGLAFLSVAFVLGLGRVIADVHYPIDFVIGTVVGICIALTLSDKKRA